MYREYQLARKLNRITFQIDFHCLSTGAERGEEGGGGGGRYSLSTIGRWSSKFISRNSHKTIWDGIVLWLNLDAAKTFNLFSVFSIIGWKVAETCGTIN